MALIEHYPQVILVGMRYPNGVAIDAENCSMLAKSLEVKLHLGKRLAYTATQGLLYRYLLLASIVTTARGWVTSECVKSWPVGRAALGGCSAQRTDVSSDVFTFEFLMLMGMLLSDAKALSRSGGRRIMMMHALPRAREPG